MYDLLIKLAPVLGIFAIGYLLKRIKLLAKEDADLLLKLVFYLAAPALILGSVSKINLNSELVYLPLIAVLIVLATYPVILASSKILKLPKSTAGTFIVGALIMNTGFLLPFYVAVYGDEGVSRAALFEFGAALLTFTFIYFLAVKHGDEQGNKRSMIKKVVLSPPLIALVLGVAINLAGWTVPALASEFLKPLANLVAPLIMLSLGIYLTPKLSNLRLALPAIGIRMIFGFCVGLILAEIFGLSGLSRTVVLLGSAAPIGYNTITFSSLQDLDKELAASLVSLSILIGIVTIPFLIWVL